MSSGRKGPGSKIGGKGEMVKGKGKRQIGEEKHGSKVNKERERKLNTLALRGKGLGRGNSKVTL